MLLGVNTNAQMSEKPRVIAMTDGEIDDQCSMIRFLLHANDMEVVAIIQTNSIFQRGGWSNAGWIEKQLDAYEQVYPNLIVHDPAYPTANELRSKLFLGDQDSTHIVVDTDVIRRVPGTESMIDPTHWADTPGSDKIVETLLENDPRKVYIQAWGGGNTAAKAFQKLKTQYPSEYERAVKKAVMYNIWYQDGAGNYIETYHPTSLCWCLTTLVELGITVANVIPTVLPKLSDTTVTVHWQPFIHRITSAKAIHLRSFIRLVADYVVMKTYLRWLGRTVL